MSAISSATPSASVGTQIVVAVLVGLLSAFAVQFLLTNLGLALGISLLKYRPQASESSPSESSQMSGSLSFVAGLGILLTLSLVLFVACFLGVRFSTASDPISGATLGIVIWSTYFLILLWVSYNAVDFLMSWVFGSVATRLRQLIEAIAKGASKATATSTQGAQDPASKLLTEEAAAKLVHQEIQTALDELDLRQRIEDYLTTIPQPQLDLTAISQGFADLIEELDLEFYAQTDLRQKIDRQTFIDLINERTNLSASETERVIDQLESVWQQRVDRYKKSDVKGELLDWLESANLEELQSQQLSERLERLKDNKSEESLAGLATGWDQIDWRAIKNALLNRIDLSQVELEDIWHTFQSVYHQMNSLAELQKLPFSTISNDVEDYLWHVPPWYLKCEKGWQEFKEVIYDPQADKQQVRSQLEQIQLADFVELLQQRDDLDSKEIDKIAKHLEAVRQEVFSLIEQAEWQQQKQKLSTSLKNYLHTVERAELQGNNFSNRIEQRLIESEINTEGITQLLRNWQQLDWQIWLEQRQDLEPSELEKTVEEINKIGDKLLEKGENQKIQIASTVKKLQQQLESYLRYTRLEHLTSEKIDAKIEQLWQEAWDDLPLVQQPLPEIECSALVKILEKRKGLDLKGVETISKQIETKLQQMNPYSSQKISALQAQSTEIIEQIVDYLSQGIKQNLNFLDIEEDLSQLLNFGKEKTTTLITQQLAQLNWNEIEAKLKQVKGGDEIQIKQAIKQLRETINKLIKLPRRWATRTSAPVKNIKDELEDFLSYSNKIELTSEHLERNLKSIINRSQKWSHSLSDSTANNFEQLAELTPATINKSLSLRPDFTPAEVEQISENFMMITHRLSEDMKTTQVQTNQLVQHLLAQIGEYLNSLNLSSLDYNKIKANLANFDFSSLINSWQKTVEEIPSEQLSTHLGKLSYESLVEMMKTSELIPDSMLSQIDGLQDEIAQQIKTIQITASQRTETLKEHTLQQVEATRKVIASAAYWMFAIIFTSALSSVVAGLLATITLVN